MSKTWMYRFDQRAAAEQHAGAHGTTSGGCLGARLRTLPT
jgi:hypothetical protein